MNEQQRLEVFRAQTTNVRELERTWKHMNRQINNLLLADNVVAVQVNTKFFALLYCALAEAIFSKIIHTPYGLSLDYIAQVKTATQSYGIKAGWIKCLELAMQSVQGSKTNHGHNVELRFKRLIEQYIFDPSLLRNKLAHGQWKIALNRDNDAINGALTNEIQNLSVVELYRRKSALEQLSNILEDVIESPNKAHHRDYWGHLDTFESEQQKMAKWTFEGKLAQLREKAAHRPKDAEPIAHA